MSSRRANQGTWMACQALRWVLAFATEASTLGAWQKALRAALPGTARLVPSFVKWLGKRQGCKCLMPLMRMCDHCDPMIRVPSCLHRFWPVLSHVPWAFQHLDLGIQTQRKLIKRYLDGHKSPRLVEWPAFLESLRDVIVLRSRLAGDFLLFSILFDFSETAKQSSWLHAAFIRLLRIENRSTFTSCIHAWNQPHMQEQWKSASNN